VLPCLAAVNADAHNVCDLAFSQHFLGSKKKRGSGIIYAEEPWRRDANS
jgi:hypothetical protein